VAASIRVFSPAGQFVIEGSEREIEDIANKIGRAFREEGGAWLSNGEWTSWIPAATPLNVDLAGDLLVGIDAIRVQSVRQV